MFSNIKVFNKVDNYVAFEVLPAMKNSTCCLRLAGFLFALILTLKMVAVHSTATR
jgi:hypothetical protein